MAISDLTPAERAWAEKVRQDIEARKAARMATESAKTTTPPKKVTVPAKPGTPVKAVAVPKPPVPLLVKGVRVPIGGLVGILVQVLLFFGLQQLLPGSEPAPEGRGLDNTITQLQQLKAISEILRPAAPAEPTAKPEPKPTAAQITSDAVKNPVSLFGIAAVGFVAVFVISQARAAGAEMTATTKDLYGEGQRVSKSLANPNTKNISRRAKS